MTVKKKAGTVALANGVLRLLQLILSAVLVGVYGYWLNKGSGRDDVFGFDSKIKLGVTAGSLSIVTALIFGIIPFLISYYFVAILFIWDWIIFFIWIAVFAWWHHTFPNQHETNRYKAVAGDKKYAQAEQSFYDSHWVDLVVMLLFLISALMGSICLLLDRKSLFKSRSVV